MSIVRFQPSPATGRDVTVSPDNPLPVSDGTTGALSDPAWNGTGNPTSMIALQKAIYDQLVAINANTAAP